MIYSYALHIVLLYPKYATAMENLKKVVKMMVSDNIAAPASVLFIIIYISVFILSTVGNTWVLLTCYKTFRRRHSPFPWLLVNLATEDLLFRIFVALGMWKQHL